MIIDVTPTTTLTPTMRHWHALGVVRAGGGSMAAILIPTTQSTSERPRDDAAGRRGAAGAIAAAGVRPMPGMRPRPSRQPDSATTSTAGLVARIQTSSGFVSLPLPYIDASLRELRRGMDELGMSA